ncbi:protocadherin Fat 4-like [Sinocyclocheilus grahami]|uniref:protocadherin Fat 4-like n=1 Tax=Sinocyclocheilus grahami TaxID=75366 RepID=UPI0007ACF614|nr:PREDICTED: protocadherin Fat 4-like [Sinocyclocheilus grahami]
MALSGRSLDTLHLILFVLWTLSRYSLSSQVRQEFEVLEEQPVGTYVGTIDTKPSFTYRFSEHHKLFSINATTGVIYTSSVIDREVLSSNIINVVVLSSQPTYPTEVRIVVLDINDNAPVFPDASIVVSFKEDASSGRQVILDTATDADIGSNGVDHTTYRIVSGNDQRKFRLDITVNPSGEGAFLHLVSTGGLDRELTPFYQLLIQVEDKGEPKKFGFLQVNVTIQDINDNPPAFDQDQYQTSVFEDTAIGSSVLQITATDLDEGANADITYFLDEGTPFQIDPKAGTVIINEGLDYETKKEYSLTIHAVDNGVPSLSGRSEATIKLLDVNDNDPVVKFRYFPTTSKFASVDENAQVGTVVALLTVSDSDSSTANGNISVSILGGNEQRHFEVHSSPVPNLSLIKVASVLDRERISAYNLTVSVSDNGRPVARSSFASLVIFVNDINDHPPIFQEAEYRVDISEDIPKGSYIKGVSATDGDSGQNANLRYSLVSGNSLGWFAISENSGLVTSAAELDREIASQIVLNISAKDQGLQPKMSYTKLIVNITDVNDQVPTFTQSTYHISLVEHLPAGSELVDLSATDSDLGANGTVRFSFDPETPVSVQNKFRLDAISGRLSTATELDREEEGFYLLHIKATDAGMPPLYTICKVNITLKDANDNSPVFYPVQYFANIKENEPSGSFVTSVTASDPDLGLNGTVKYAITAGDSYKFHINNNSGKITTLVPLDREEKTAYQLQVTATDGGGLRSNTQAIVTVTVVDTQDNPPVFSQKEYSFVMFENVAADTIIGTVSATTVDLNTNITYLIASGDQRGLFAIKGSTGQITALGLIDREEQAFYQLRVIARGGEVMGEALVNITVKDLNDNAPHFIHNVEHVSAVENWATGHHIFQAKASDPDEGTNGMVIYSLKQNPKGLFHIHERHGLITLTSPLEVTTSSYQVEVMASDLGIPQRTTSLILTISVYDVNDNVPVFDQLSYEVTILESEPVNSRFFKVEASDKDSGLNGEIVYDIVSGNTNDVFGIFPDGQLYIKADLDREVQDRYSLLVVAKDRAVEPLSASINVTILLDDVNDNRPLFNSTYYVFHFEEEQERGSFVGLVFAKDKDFGPNSEVRYSFETPQPNFELNAISGALTSTLQLDRESLMRQRGAAVFSFTVVSSDQGLPKPLKDQAKVQVYIQDINDNPPKFTKDIYQASISESAQNMTQLLRVSASDVDENKNGLIRYDIMEGNEEKQFSIDSTSGQVTLVGKLDYETTPFYSLKIMAEDSGIVPLSSTCVLSISVLDDNDNSPSFPKSTLTVDVLENMRIGELVASVTATDSDSGSNADITYSISATNNHGTFSISPNTGSIFLVKKLDYETQSLYKLNVTAKDSGRPSRSSSIPVTIHVRDFNDNPPVFTPGDIFKSIPENLLLSTSVMTITAHDTDADINGQLEYSIVMQTPRGGHFHIDPTSGVILTNKEIDREFSNLFELTIKATDQAVPVEFRRFALKNVTIWVTDQNDNIPVFISQNALVAESNIVIGSILTTVVAYDPDEGANGEVEYELVRGDSDTFIMDRYSGDIRLASQLVPSKLIYSLTVSATDHGTDRKTSRTELTIILQGSDGPVFSQHKYITILKEGQPPGTNVISLDASSPRGTGTKVEFFIVSVRSGGKAVGRLFTIGRHSGVIQTAAKLDREQGSDLYLIDVYAIEADASQPRTQHAEGANALVTYSIISGADDSFRIDPESGELTAIRHLDRERRSKYSLLVRADDGQQSSDVRVNITVSDVNDHTPHFSRNVYSFDIPEDTSPGSIVAAILASDSDSGSNGEITYSIEEDDEDATFLLNPVTGVFNISRALDYESQQYFILTVQARDGGGLSSSVRVYFNLLDVNDNPPRFHSSVYSSSVPESVIPGATVLSLSAADADDGPNAELHYTIASGDPHSQFTVTDAGVLQTRNALDRETQSFYNLVITVNDLALPPLSRFTSTTQVSIILLDVNDCPPSFTSQTMAYIQENTPVDTLVFTAQATDADSGPNSYVEYSLKGPFGNKFSVGNIDGGVILVGELDREEMANYSLTIVATDKGEPPLSSRMEVTMIVLDVNDNTPSFSQNIYDIEIEENTLSGADVLQVFASDADEGTNGQIRFSIAGGNANSDFRIDSVTGVISVAKLLDRETRSAYSLLVQAADRGSSPRVDRATVNIVLLDVNDCTPVFELSPYSISVQENLGNLPKNILQVVARDDDLGTNGQISYSLSSGNDAGAFSLTSGGQLNLIRTLDRETQDKYTLIITAHDAGKTAACFSVVARDDDLGTNGQISYSLSSGNDAGAFSLTSGGQLNLIRTLDRETQDKYTLIITAHDAEQETALERRDSALLQNRLPFGNKFSIGNIDGGVILVGELDREEMANYSLTIVATDKGEPPLSSRMEVTMIVLDVNDNTPSFSQNIYDIEIEENTLSGADVVQVFASDADEGTNGQIRFSIAGGNANSDFRIDSVTGVISVAKLLDRETRSAYSLLVQAADRGSSPRVDRATVNIVLLDVNDCTPVFELSPYSISVQENLGNLPKNILQVVARDDDLGTNGQISYSLSSGNDAGAFSLTSGGQLNLIRTLDRETQDKYTLIITAHDAGTPSLSSSGTVMVLVGDVNDNIPSFSSMSFHTTIPEDAPTGTDVLLLNSSDADVGLNGVISYSLSGGDGQFSINPATGLIITSSLLDREARSSYQLLVVASDGGQPTPLSSSATVSVVVADINDNPPRFHHHPYVTHIPASTSTGSLVFAVTVTDEDFGSNAQLHYSLTGRNSEKFRIDPIRGAITANEKLTGSSEVTFTVHVKDGGTNPKTDSTTVTVRFVTGGDFPHIRIKEKAFTFPENQPTNTVVTKVTGSSPRAGPLSYYIASGNLDNAFHIDQLSGELSIKKPLDYENIEKYVLWIEARDQGFPPYSAYEKVEIAVLDVNDNHPNFEQEPFHAEILENLSPQRVLIVSAFDQDSGPNGQLEYAIIEGNKENSFSINRATGEIRTTRPLDREKVAQYALRVKATDRGSPPKNTAVKVLISVLDVNDNAPRFSKIFSATVPENAPVGFTVTRVTTTDEDSGANAISRYSISDASLPFIIHPSTGDITISRPLNREDTDHYIAKVSAHDSGWTVSTDVTIFVTDVNDNAPRFSKPSYYLDYPELTEVGSIVTQVSATDPDEGFNGKIFYFIRSQTEYFRINSSSGEIFVKQQLRYQNSSGHSNVNVNRHSFIVTTSDRGIKPLMSETTVIINVVDSNDNPPTFESSFYFTPVTKSVKVGTRLLKVTAHDHKDFGLNSEIEYAVSGGNSSSKFRLDKQTGSVTNVCGYSLSGGDGQFSINPSTGLIITSSLLDREARASYQLLVVATDGGQPTPLSSSATVSVVVADINDNPPRFHHHPYVTHIPASTSTGSLVFAVTVTDEDFGSNAQLHYSLTGRNSEKFRIDPIRGAITANEKLTGSSEVTFTVHVKDGGTNPKTDSTTVTVRFVTGGDFPHIRIKEKAFTFPENQPTNTVVTKVTGSSPRAGPLSYYIASGNLDNAFHIDQLSGELSIKKPLDYENIEKYVLWIEARDQGFPPYSAYEKVEIAVLDVNDNHPNFEQEPFHAEILENLSPQRVLIVSAFDQDSGPNGQLEYAIIEGNKENSFSINRATGEIRTTRPLDREKVAQYALRVKATDRGSPPKNTAVKVLISVLDVNDNAPRFSKIFSATVPENAPVGFTVTRVTTTDEDSGANAISRYSISDASLPFIIHPSTGDITISRPLNREDTDHYIAKVSAHDSGWTVSTDVTIFVTDVNDNAPRFSKPSYYLDYPELTEVGSIVTQVSATDPDEGFNAAQVSKLQWPQ